MTVALKNAPHKKRVASQHFKGTIDNVDFTANVFSIKRTEGRWTISGSRLDTHGISFRNSCGSNSAFR